MHLPKCYGPVWRNALRANAGHQDLGSQYEHYFDVGVQLSVLVDENELGDLGKELLTGFSSRFHGLLDAALNLTDQVSADAPAIGRPPRHAARRCGLVTRRRLRWPQPRPCAGHRHGRSPPAHSSPDAQIDSSALKHKLTLREKNIFDTGRDASQGWHRWKSERTRAKIEPSTLVGNKRKHGAQTA